MDMREAMREVIHDFPTLRTQRNICEESYRSLSSGESYRSYSPKGRVVYMNSKIEQTMDGIIIGETKTSVDFKKYKPNVKKRVAVVSEYSDKKTQKQLPRFLPPKTAPQGTKRVNNNKEADRIEVQCAYSMFNETVMLDKACTERNEICILPTDPTKESKYTDVKI